MPSNPTWVVFAVLMTGVGSYGCSSDEEATLNAPGTGAGGGARGGSSGVAGGGAQASAGSGGMGASNRPACSATEGRFAVTSTTVPSGVDTSIPVAFTTARPTMLTQGPDGTLYAAWAGTDGMVRVSTVSDDDTVDVAGAFAVTGDGVRGLAISDVGIGLLVRSGEIMRLVQLSSTGAVDFDVMLAGGNDKEDEGDIWVNMWGHNGRLVWTGEHYAAYFGIARNWGTDGVHQGDTLVRYTSAGENVGGGWAWGCSHSDDVRLTYTGSGPRHGLIPVCGSDCYPEPGIIIDNNVRVFEDTSGNCSGSIVTMLGEMVAQSGGTTLFFASSVGRSSHDLAMVPMTDGGVPSDVVWITDTADIEEWHPHAATYDGFDALVGWSTEWVNNTVTFVSAVDGGSLVGPVLEVPVATQRAADWLTTLDGDVVWLSSSDDEVLEVTRIFPCQPS